MILGFVKVRYTGPVPGTENLSQRQFNALIVEAWEDVGDFWFDHMLPKHFTKAGAREYGYQPRKGEPGNAHRKGFWSSYTGRKQKTMHHTDPLVWSGALKRGALGSYRVHSTATSKQSKMSVILPGARAANRRSPHSRIHMREELTTISQSERLILTDLHNQKIEERLAAIRTISTWQKA